MIEELLRRKTYATIARKNGDEDTGVKEGSRLVGRQCFKLKGRRTLAKRQNLMKVMRKEEP